MKAIDTYQNKKVLVLGLAKSGVSAARLLHQLGAIVTVNDGKALEDNPEAQDLLTRGIKVITGSHPIELLDEAFELIVKNPGIPYTNPILVKGLEKEIPIITEVELAYQISEAPMIGITGTNGKTTTTTMTAAVLNSGKKSEFAYLAGNIGEVASQVAQEVTSENVMVTELSSFQLMGIQTFKPSIAMIINLFEAHIDYHESRENYVAAKWAIQKNMTQEDILILNFNQEELRHLSLKTNATVLPFSTTETLSNGVYLKDGSIYYKDEQVMSVEDIGVPGSHNIGNAMAAIAVGKLYQVSNEDIMAALHDFHGVEHRMEFVGNIDGRKVYNDSKATNILATKTALEAFLDKKDKVILIAGGLDRGNDFVDLEPSLKGLKGVVFYGESKEKLYESGEKVGLSHLFMTEELNQAVTKAYELSNEGDVILFSPACASWDQFTNFEVRGRAFKEQIKNIEKGLNP